MSDLVGLILADRYRVDAFLGRGGMAEVYKVWDNQRSVYLAMKMLHADLAEDRVFLRRFQREAETLAKLQHPYIVRFYGLEQSGHQSFILMDYVDGHTLRQEIFDAAGPLPMKRILEILRPVCSALHFAHHMGMVHCDVKPANIMVKKNGDIQLSDFGIARMTESATTATMVGMGTPAYMSPEQARGLDPTPQTDIYAMGIVLYEMFTGGERPFTGENAQTTGSTSEKVRWEQMHLAPPSPRGYNPAISLELEALVMKCLEKDPAKRYISTLELINALELTGGQRYTTVSSSRSADRVVPPSIAPFPIQVAEPITPPKQELRSSDSVSESLPIDLNASPQAELPRKFRGEQIPSRRSTNEIPSVSADQKRALPAWVLWASGLGLLMVLYMIVRPLIHPPATTVTHPPPTSIAAVLPQTGVESPTLRATEMPFPTKTPKPTNTPIPTDLLIPSDTSIPTSFFEYKIQAGDILSDIATRFGIDLQTLLALNPSIDPTNQIIYVGQKILVPPPNLHLPTDTPISALKIGSIQLSEIDGMVQVYVPVGSFQMGSTDTPVHDSQPIHTVILDAFWMDQTEVTNRMYMKCVDFGICTLPHNESSAILQDYFRNSKYDNYPVINVDWNQAQAYCVFAYRRLPTEAEWEYAARGGLEGKTYPWGNENPVCTLGAENGANFGNCSYDDTIKVGSFQPNAFGLFDMAGNVEEWVADYYDSKYYSYSPSKNPIGPTKTGFHVLRGGEWNRTGGYMCNACRISRDTADWSSFIGFRCASSP